MTQLPRGWIDLSLSTVARLVSGAGFPIQLQNKKGLRYPFFKVGNLSDAQTDQYLLHSDHTIDGETARFLQATIIPKDAIVFAKIGMAIRLNRRRLVGLPSCIDNNLMAVVPYEVITPRYLLRFLETIDLMPLSRSTTVPALRKSDLEALRIPLPPLREQRRILAKLEKLLSCVNAAQERLAIVPKILKRFRQSVLSDACRGRLTANWRIHNAAKSTWPIYRLSEVGTISGGVTKNTKRAHLSLKRPYLRVANVYENRLKLDEVLEIGITEQEMIRTTLRKGDVLFVEGNGSLNQIGRVAVWDGSIKDCVHQNHLIKFRAGEKVLPTFVLLQMMSPDGRAQLTEKATSTAGLNTLSISKISDICLPLPGIDEQEEIVRRVQALFKTADALEARYLKARAQVGKLTQSILAKAFRGELVPQDPNDEPASVLLDRIKADRNGSAVVKRRNRK